MRRIVPPDSVGASAWPWPWGAGGSVAREGHVSITGCATGTRSGRSGRYRWRPRQAVGGRHYLLSDQGGQDTSISFTERRRDMGIYLSTWSVGDRFDNAMRESFFATLGCTPIDRRSFRTRSEARLAVSEFVKGFYDPRPCRSAIDCDSPMSYERRLKSAPSPESNLVSTRSGQLHAR
jgi:transposase InsO family protein